VASFGLLNWGFGTLSHNGIGVVVDKPSVAISRVDVCKVGEEVFDDNTRLDVGTLWLDCKEILHPTSVKSKNGKTTATNDKDFGILGFPEQEG
jgi:hypothetical protein